MSRYNIFIIFVFVVFIVTYINDFKFITTNYLPLKELKNETKIKNFKNPLLYTSIVFIFLSLYYFIFNGNYLKIIQTQKEIVQFIPLSNIQENLILEKTYLENNFFILIISCIIAITIILWIIWKQYISNKDKEIIKKSNEKKWKLIYSELLQKIDQNDQKRKEKERKENVFLDCKNIIINIFEKSIERIHSEKINRLLDGKINEFNTVISNFFKYLEELLLNPQLAEFVTKDNLQSTIDQYYASKEQPRTDVILETGQILMLYISDYNIKEKLSNLSNFEKEKLIEKITSYINIYDEDWSAFRTFLINISRRNSSIQDDLLDLMSDESLTELPSKNVYISKNMLEIERQLTKIDSEKIKLKKYYEKEKINLNKISNLEQELILKSDPKQLKNITDQLKDIKTFELEQKEIVESLILILNQQTLTLFQLESQINYLQLENIQLQELKEKNSENKTFYEDKLTDINNKIITVTKLIEKINEKFEKSIIKLKHMYNMLKTIYNVKFNIDFKTYITNYINNNDSLKLELKDNILLQNQTTFFFEVTGPTSFKVNDNFIFLKDIIQSELGAIIVHNAIIDNISKIDLSMPGYLILVFIYFINNYNKIESKDLIPFVEQMKQFKKYINANVFEANILRKSSSIYSFNNFYIEHKTAIYDEITPEFLQKIFILFFIYIYILKKYFSNKINYDEIISFFKIKDSKSNQIYHTLYLRLKNAKQFIKCYIFSNKKYSNSRNFLYESLNSFLLKENIELEFEKIRIPFQ